MATGGVRPLLVLDGPTASLAVAVCIFNSSLLASLPGYLLVYASSRIAGRNEGGSGLGHGAAHEVVEGPVAGLDHQW